MKKKTKNKKTKVKMTVDGYYTDDNGFGLSIKQSQNDSNEEGEKR